MDANTGAVIDNICETTPHEGAETTPLQSTPTLGQIIARFKYLVSKTNNEIDGTPGDPERYPP